MGVEDLLLVLDGVDLDVDVEVPCVTDTLPVSQRERGRDDRGGEDDLGLVTTVELLDLVHCWFTFVSGVGSVSLYALYFW